MVRGRRGWITRERTDATGCPRRSREGDGNTDGLRSRGTKQRTTEGGEGLEMDTHTKVGVLPSWSLRVSGSQYLGSGVQGIPRTRVLTSPSRTGGTAPRPDPRGPLQVVSGCRGSATAPGPGRGWGHPPSVPGRSPLETSTRLASGGYVRDLPELD